ncbi:MAG: UvrD-helicase domain-containing protein, partial [Deltaproteobacteria bacterium]|nr:UvrD-helicase domain-containing protein [Deltaproteobacteria bacterium]
MKFIADLHIHSHYSRATSKTLDPEHLALWAQKKGIAVIGTGDFTHPGWVKELQEKLVEAENGLYQLAPPLTRDIETEIPPSCKSPTRFLLSGEISCIYKRDGKTRKVHNLILLPDFPSVIKFQERLDRIGNITSDGRPILGLDARDLLEIVLEVSDRAFFIPAHIWTPWFSLFGSKSGFDAIEECFDDLTPHIHALETGLSSDPPMNRLLSALDDYLLVSNSDAHSPGKLGREANIFDTPLDYDTILDAMVTGHGFEGTIEFYPEEGKYHLDGHRKCDIRFEPGETIANKGICPSCGKPLTVGVLHRVEELSDRKKPRLSKGFHSLIPLQEILSELLDCGPSTKKVMSAYEDLLTAIGPELHILMQAPIEELEQSGGPLLARAIDRMRNDRVIRLGGYDGEYGVIRLFHEEEKSELLGQSTLFKAPKRKAPKKYSRPKARKAKKIREPKHSEKPEVIDPVLDPLNPEQRDAVLHPGGHLLIVAGPGTGKTRTLTHRIAHLLRSKEAGPDQILGLTFTNKAAREMQERLKELASADVRVATFHAFCLDILGQEGEKANIPEPFVLCSEMDAPVLVKQVISDAGKGKRALGAFLKNLAPLKAASV